MYDIQERRVLLEWMQITWHGWDVVDTVVVQFEDAPDRNQSLAFRWSQTLRFMQWKRTNSSVRRRVSIHNRR